MMVYKIGIVAGYIVNDYKQNPFTHKHSLKPIIILQQVGKE
jgi:hypothetical protein